MALAVLVPTACGKKGAERLTPDEKDFVANQLAQIDRAKHREAVGWAFGQKGATLYDEDIRKALDAVATVAPDKIGEATGPLLTDRYDSMGCLEALENLATVAPDKRSRAFIEECQLDGNYLVHRDLVHGVWPEYVILAGAMAHNAADADFADLPEHKAAINGILGTPDIAYTRDGIFAGGDLHDPLQPVTTLPKQGPVWLWVQRGLPRFEGRDLNATLGGLASGRHLVFRTAGRRWNDVPMTWGHPTPEPEALVELRLSDKATTLTASDGTQRLTDSASWDTPEYEAVLYTKLAAIADKLPKVRKLVVVVEPKATLVRLGTTLAAAYDRLDVDAPPTTVRAWRDADVKRRERVDLTLFERIYLTTTPSPAKVLQPPPPPEPPKPAPAAKPDAQGTFVAGTDAGEATGGPARPQPKRPSQRQASASPSPTRPRGLPSNRWWSRRPPKWREPWSGRRSRRSCGAISAESAGAIRTRFCATRP